MKHVPVADLVIGNDLPLTVIAGPCTLESAGMGQDIAGVVKAACDAAGAQYIFNYNLNDGWYLYSNATITADWEADSGNCWTVPVGGGAGKIFNIGEQPLSASFQLLSNVEKPDGAPDWGWNFQLAVLFP